MCATGWEKAGRILRDKRGSAERGTDGNSERMRGAWVEWKKRKKEKESR